MLHAVWSRTETEMFFVFCQYTGWSPLDKDIYAPITVDVIRHNNNNLTVQVQWDKLNIINADSD